jgi:glycosyltransferase involved in cell wall biosynthesis
MKTDIHFVHFNTSPGGIEVKRPLLITNLKDFYFSVFVIRPPAKNVINVYSGLLINVSYGENGIIGYWKLLKYALKYKSEIFHVFNIGPFALLILRLAGVRKLIYGVHGTIYWKTRTQYFFRKPAWKLAMSNKYVITSNSVFSGEVFVKQVLNKTKPILLYNPIDSTRFIPPGKRNFNNECLKIIYSGRLTSGKNLFNWIKIAEEINKKHPGCRFEIYGDGPLKQKLSEFILQRSLQEVVIMMGFSTKIEEIYKNADLLMFLSEYESFGNVVVESILCETPVIAIGIPSMKEIFMNYPEFLVEQDQNLEFNILKKIEEINSLRISAKMAAIEFREKFSLNQHLSKVNKIYASFNS